MVLEQVLEGNLRSQREGQEQCVWGGGLRGWGEVVLKIATVYPYELIRKYFNI